MTAPTDAQRKWKQAGDASESARAWSNTGMPPTQARRRKPVAPPAVLTRIELPMAYVAPLPVPVRVAKVIPVRAPAPPTGDPEWRSSALCAQTDPDAFHPDRGESPATAKRICKACPVTAECLADALASGERYGVRAGLTAKQRMTMLRRGVA